MKTVATHEEHAEDGMVMRHEILKAHLRPKMSEMIPKEKAPMLGKKHHVRMERAR